MSKKVTAPKILLLLSDGKSRSSREIRKEIGLSRDAIGSSLIRLWKNGSILRTKKPNFSKNTIFRGRAGQTSNLRLFHLYVLRPGDTKLLNLHGQTFVSYSKEYADRRGSVDRKSKSMTVLDFIKAYSRRNLDNRTGYSDYESRIGRAVKAKDLGYQLHLAVDAKSELPVAMIVVSANENEKKQSISLFTKASQYVKPGKPC